MNIKSLITDIMSLSKTNLESNKLTNNQNVGTFILSSESLDGATREHAESTLNSIIAGIDDSITAAVASNNLSTEELTLRMNAASKIAGLAVNPNIARESLGKLKKVDADKGAVVVNDNSIVDVVFQGELSTEAFDDQAINNAIYYSVAYNFAAARQDAFGEAFFPTIVVDPTQSGILVETEVISLMSEIERSIDGTPNKKSFNKKVITKAIYDSELLDNNRNKVVPVKSNAADRRTHNRQGQGLPEQLHAGIRIRHVMYDALFEPNVRQRFHVILKRPPRADAASARNFARARPAVANRAHPAKSSESRSCLFS